METLALADDFSEEAVLPLPRTESAPPPLRRGRERKPKAPAPERSAALETARPERKPALRPRAKPEEYQIREPPLMTELFTTSVEFKKDLKFALESILCDERIRIQAYHFDDQDLV